MKTLTDIHPLATAREILIRSVAEQPDGFPVANLATQLASEGITIDPVALDAFVRRAAIYDVILLVYRVHIRPSASLIDGWHAVPGRKFREALGNLRGNQRTAAPAPKPVSAPKFVPAPDPRIAEILARRNAKQKLNRGKLHWDKHLKFSWE